MDTGTDEFKLRTTLETALRFWSSTHQLTFWQRSATYFQLRASFADSNGKMERDQLEERLRSASARMRINNRRYGLMPAHSIVAVAIGEITFVHRPSGGNTPVYDATITTAQGTETWKAVELTTPPIVPCTGPPQSKGAPDTQPSVLMAISFVLQLRGSALTIHEMGSDAPQHSGATIAQLRGNRALTGGSRQIAELWDDTFKLCRLLAGTHSPSGFFSEDPRHKRDFLGELLIEAFVDPCEEDDGTLTCEKLQQIDTYTSLGLFESFSRIQVSVQSGQE